MSPSSPLTAADQRLLIAMLGVDAASTRSALQEGARPGEVHADLKSQGGLLIATLDAFATREQQASAQHALEHGPPGFSDKVLMRELDVKIRALRQQVTEAIHGVLRASKGIELDLDRPHQGFPAIVLASQHGLGEVVSDLVKHGADPHVRTGLRSSALHQAALQMRVGVMRRLVSMGVDLDAQDDTGRTPAHMAAGEGHLMAMRELKRLGANLSIQDKFGNTAAERLRSRGQGLYEKWAAWEGTYKAKERATNLEGRFPVPEEPSRPKPKVRF